jgi:hypothetical protein
VNRKIYALVQSGAIKLGHPSMDTRLLDAHIAKVAGRTPQEEGRDKTGTGANLGK